MPRNRIPILVIALGVVLISAVQAAPPPVQPTHVIVPPAPPAAPRSTAAIEATRRAAVERLALQAEMEQRLERGRKDVAALQARHDASPDYALRRALQQRIEAAKREGALDLYRIQLRHAQAAGRLDQVREIETILEARARLPVAPVLPLPAAAPPPARTPPPVKERGR